ncbi:MAG: bacillithiol biosynthesis cysteine-adding enzyme BshC [bacterium]
MNISHSRQFSKLAVDYITAFNSSPIRNFFPVAPSHDDESFPELLKWRVEQAATPNARSTRQILLKSLREQHHAAKSLSVAVENNLKSLESERCLAVVTGQQVGIFGGPLYTVYKALHTIILSKHLKGKHPEYDFVPIFWQETEDHDFEETSFVNLITSQFELRKFSYHPSNDFLKMQVGGIDLETQALETLYSEIESSIPKTDFSESVLNLYKDAYRSGKTFAEAQAVLLGTLFSDDGLLVLNANTPELKAQSRSLFAQEINTAPQLSKQLQLSTTELSGNGYHAQIEPQGVNLFVIDEGRRYKLQQAESGFTINAKPITASALEQMLVDSPQLFSMNVVMRPLVQDTILPTAAYIAGPGEIAYFAQLSAAYDWAGIKMPAIVPRIGFTIVEDRFDQLLTKYDISAEQYLNDSEEITSNILKSEQEELLATSFDAVHMHIEAELEKLRPHVTATDVTLDQALTSIKGKMLTTLKDFENKSLSAERKKQNTIKTQFEKMRANLLPNGKLQERELSLLYFLNKYGFEFWTSFKKKMIATPPSNTEHSIVRATEIMQKST